MSTTKDINPSYQVFERLVKNAKVTSNRVAKEIGFGVSTIYDWKNGKSAPKTYKLIKIADYFGVDVRDFFEGM